MRTYYNAGNYRNYSVFSIFGQNFSIKNTLWGLLFSLPFAGLTVLFVFLKEWYLVVTMLIVIIFILFIFNMDFNGQPLPKFLRNIIKMLANKNQRMYLYNPRLKTLDEYEDATKKERAAESGSFFAKAFSTTQKKKDIVIPIEEEMFFAEDEGIIDKPEAYKSAKEIKAEVKAAKKQLKKDMAHADKTTIKAEVNQETRVMSGTPKHAPKHAAVPEQQKTVFTAIRKEDNGNGKKQ